MFKLNLLLFFALLSNNVLALPDLKLPFESGNSWVMTRGYENPACVTDPQIDCTSHTNWGSWADDRFALDFAGGGCSSWNQPALAAAYGKVIEIYTVDSGSYGRYVIIDHEDGYRSRYAHLESVGVIVDQSVGQGQEIGKIGNSGTGVVGTACAEHPGTHLHFSLYRNGGGVTPEPMSGHSNFTDFVSYLSNNQMVLATDSSGSFYQSVLNTYDNYSFDVLGYPFDHGGGPYLHDWYGVLIQDFQHPDCPKGDCSNAPAGSQHVGDDGQSAIVYNPSTLTAHLLHDGFWRFYKTWIDPENKDFRPQGPVLEF